MGVTLMRWGNIIVKAIKRDAASGRVTAVDAKLDLGNKNFKGTQKVTWVADVTDLVAVDSVEFDFLITKDKLEDGDELEDYLTSKDHPTRSSTAYLADPNI